MKKFAVIIASAMLAAAAVCSTASAAEIKAQVNVDMSKDFEDGIYRVGFNVKDDVTDKEIFALIYDTMDYDIVDISKLAVGDTIETPDGDMEVETIEQEDNTILINGGVEQNGYTLVNEEDSNGWTAKDYELPVFKLVGQAQLSLGDKITLNVYKMDEDASLKGDGYDTTECTPEELQSKLQEVADKLTDNFTPAQISVRLENQKVVEVTINYVP